MPNLNLDPFTDHFTLGFQTPFRGVLSIATTARFSFAFCFSGKRQASLLVVVKCNELIMITGRESCSCVQSVEGATRRAEAGQSKGASRSVRELGSASLNKTMGVASLSEMVKPAWEGKSRPRAPFQLPGVVGDSAHRNNQQELGRPCLNPGPAAGERTPGSHNRWAVRVRESDGFIVAAKFWLSRNGAKEPWPRSRGVRSDWN